MYILHLFPFLELFHLVFDHLSLHIDLSRVALTKGFVGYSLLKQQEPIRL